MGMNPKPWILLFSVILLVFCAFAGIASAESLQILDDETLCSHFGHF
jgi:hypothetical protein